MTRALPSSPTRLCVCGCGRAIEPGSTRQLFDMDVCRARWVRDQIAEGKLPPTAMGICECCGAEFPRYKSLPYTMKKKFCTGSCARKNRTKTGAPIGFGDKHLTREEKRRRRELAAERRNTCFRRYRPCSKYHNWLSEPDYHCECSGYEPGELPQIKYDSRKALKLLPGNFTVTTRR